MICRRLGPWGNRAANLLVRLVIYMLLFLIPIHVIATLQLVGMIEAFTLFHIAAFDAAVFLSLLIWNYCVPPTPNSEDENDSAEAFFQPLPKSVIISLLIVAGCYFVFALNLFTSYPQGPDGDAPAGLQYAEQFLDHSSLSKR